MAYNVGQTLGVALAVPSATASAELGSFLPGSDGNFYQYVRANGALVVGDFVGITENFDATPLTTTTAGSVPMAVGVAQAIAADNDYLYVVRMGENFYGKLAASCVLDVALYTTGTAGVVDDSSTTLIKGLRSNATVTGAAVALCSAGTMMYVN